MNPFDPHSRRAGTGCRAPGGAAAFTIMEIAISLAIIGFALVAIIGVLPYGMTTQRDNREETIINQDATVFMESIRNAAVGADHLTNYVRAITNTWAEFNDQGQMVRSGTDGYDGGGAVVKGASVPSMALTNGANIIGLLSLPEFASLNDIPLADVRGLSYVSNHVVAWVGSISGVAAEKPPQDNSIMREDTFSYRVYAVNAPMAMDLNQVSAYARQLSSCQRELRLTFYWPLLSTGATGSGRQTYRATIAGRLAASTNFPGQVLYYYQPQVFTNAP